MFTIITWISLVVFYFYNGVNMKIKQTIETGNLQIGDIYIKSGINYLVVDDSLGEIQVEVDNPLMAWKKKITKN